MKKRSKIFMALGIFLLALVAIYQLRPVPKDKNLYIIREPSQDQKPAP